MLDGFLTLMDRGGPLMWVIFGTASVAAAMLVERGITLVGMSRRAQLEYARLRAGEAGISSLRGGSGTSPLSRLMSALPWPTITSREKLVQEVNIQLAGTMSQLEGTLPTIATLGSLLPMLGLLGTVTGMISVFNAIALHGSGQPAAMASGISQALLTTASGLAMAIPVIFFHHLLERRLATVLTVTEQSLHLLLNADLEDVLAAGGEGAPAGEGA